MSIIYTSSDGDILDKICYDYYGSSKDIVEQVIATNPHLVNLDAILDAGVRIILPDIEASQKEVEEEVIRLWS